MPASRRVSPSQRFRAQLDDLFASGRELGQILEEVARLGVALLFQTAPQPLPLLSPFLRHSGDGPDLIGLRIIGVAAAFY